MADLEKHGYYVCRAEFQTGKGNALEIQAGIKSRKALSKWRWLYFWKTTTTLSPIPQALYSVTSYFILQIVVSLLPPLQPGWTFSFLRLVYLHFCLIFWGHLLFEVSHHAVKKPKLVHAKRPWREPIYKYLGQLLADVQPTAKVSHQIWKWILLRTI